ncbi:excinuclease ABC subunit UvrC [Fischerella thermalis]|uniref:UvrABC system protein C n=3 Tax=Fischerella TaxID=1190 RepID=G6FR17_9CYAN|nr:excinuclease ABC subunit UvrC [Fischerella thermalis]PMB01831.1 excinuclease ABC subunit C [Fischerella thermalis CCMEE 5273]EHC15891.1 UvrABC system protein C [Fischerella thermalis JSC-11]PLZ11176.1 excinuclease ABC subunit C [Fischerella thermalis WC119]PLZ15328.1 excinuclease ABC subunit C [Fischerella thermalis WC114]PLZ20106.1 excinuclease ABC subunit C [Fischerella thermalis WC1110]
MTTSAQTPPLIKDPQRLENRLAEIPQEPGVYLMRDGSDRIIYVGKSRKLRSRVRSYFRESQKLTERIATMVRQVTEIEFIVTDTEAEALALEANLIKQHLPYFNVLLKDDKKYPYVCITWSEDYPRIYITRKRQLSNQKDKYYGPYTDSHLLREILRLCKRIFPLRQRPQPLFKDRPCLNFDLGRCPGVCQSLISPEEYRKIVQKVAMVFQGRSSELIDILTEQMHKQAELLNFEAAARFRDQINGLKSLSAEQKVSLPDDTVSRDAIALAADAQHACIQLFQIRAGKLVGRLAFVAEVPTLSSPSKEGGLMGAILQRVLEEHYQTAEAVEIPTEILVQYELPEPDILADVLTQRKGRKVTILAPQRQTKAELIEMVERNAQYELQRMQKLSDRNQQAMEDLAAILDLPELPHRIEGYDISHIQGSNAVASQVVFIDGLPAKQHYRHYKIKNPTVTVGHSDDFASLAEVIGRRFRKYAEDPQLQRTGNSDWPDLIMIDGGKGQLSSVVAVLQEMNLLEDLRVISLAKKREEIFLPGESEPLTTDAEQPGVQLLRRLRDEAHRFAVSFHRQQRSDKLKRSRLDEIPGLGHHRQKQLLGHFRSVDYIRQATPTQLAEVPGIGPRLAQEIYDYFHPS